MPDPQARGTSPSWSPTTKLVVGLTFISAVAALLVRFRNIIGPLLLAFILAYILHPLADFLHRSTRLSWRWSVNLIFLLVVVLLGALFSVAGLAIVQQIQSLILVVQRSVLNLPQVLENLSTQVIQIGPFTFDLSQYLAQAFDLGALSEQVLAVVQPVLGRVGNLVGVFAASAVVTLGWGLFILLISYFVLADAARGFPDALLNVEIPGYQDDVRRLGRELRRIWNAFLRGQILIFALAVVSYSILMTILGLRFALGLAILAGLARFAPYIGPLTTWSVVVLVALFQERNYFGLTSFQYAVLVLAAALILDQIFDNLVSPRLLGRTLGVHPAAILVAAIIATNLIGIIGLFLAAPVLSTLQLFGRFAFRKMFDLDPWPEPEPEPMEMMGYRALRRWIQRARQFLQRKRGAEDV